ncbi:MAG: hypothetical protein KZQ84_04840 [Candidatus Thiodiazotropha sp. (ex Lucinoma borealis)]|nr:hypothetical protein [Candidatus Thiodiazotropha sp. (ex Lucinoma borealis)]
MIPINYQVTGEEEYSFRLEIDRLGNYTVHTLLRSHALVSFPHRRSRPFRQLLKPWEA